LARTVARCGGGNAVCALLAVGGGLGAGDVSLGGDGSAGGVPARIRAVSSGDSTGIALPRRLTLAASSAGGDAAGRGEPGSPLGEDMLGLHVVPRESVEQPLVGVSGRRWLRGLRRGGSEWTELKPRDRGESGVGG
jgi:hypothetical protein